MGNVDVRIAAPADLPEVLRVQYDAFGRVASMFDIPRESLAPLNETLEDLKELLGRGMRFFVAEMDDAIVGSVRGMQDGATVEIGRLVVASGYTRRGVASSLMDALESSFVGANRFVLFTGAEADVPLALYAGRGYSVFRRESLPHVELVWLEKEIPGR